MQRGSDISVSFSNGDRFGAVATSSGQVKVYKNTTLLATMDVTGWPYYSSGGYVGVWTIGASGNVLDDFGGGNVPQSYTPLQSLAAFWASIRGWFGGAKEADLVPLGVSLREPEVKLKQILTPPAGQEWHSYYYVGGQRVAMRIHTSVETHVYYLHADHLGSTSLITDESGVVVSEIRYKAWGEVRYASGATPTDYKYTGQLETDIGIYYFVARFFDLNRFLSPDDIVPDPYNPLDWDRYSYCRNNPINNIDPSGHITKAIFAGDGDVWSPPISSYGVTVSEGWTLEDKVQIASELQIMSNMLTSMCPDGNCFGMAPHEVFHKVFGDTTISRIYDGEGIGCVAGNPVECSEGTGGQLILNSQNGLIIHEFGHNFDHKINGWGYARSTLANSTISVNGDHVSGYYPTTGTYERTTRGYRSDNYPDVQHPLRKDGNSTGEDFADMFLNYSRGTFATDIYGQARYLWMVGNMASWMGTISSRWQK